LPDGEAGETGGNQVRTITIRLPDVETAMLVEVQKWYKLLKHIRVFPGEDKARVSKDQTLG